MINKLLNLGRLAVLSALVLVAGCSDRHELVVQGYIEGLYTYLAPAISGKLENLLVDRGDKIKSGDLVFVLDQQPESDQLQQAEKDLSQTSQILVDLEKGQRQTILDQIVAQRAQAVALKTLDEKTLWRYQALYKKGAINKESVDTALSNYQRDVEKISELDADLAEAKLGARVNQIQAQEETVAAARANVAQMKWALEQKTMTAPVSGLVFDTYYREGEFVPANQPVASLLAPENIKIIFYVSESVLSKIAIGQKVQFGCDSCKAKTDAIISFISSDAEYTPPVIYSKDTRDKLVYRVEAKIAPDIALQFHTGQPVDVYFEFK